MKRIVLTFLLVSCLNLEAQTKEELKKENDQLKVELRKKDVLLKKQTEELGRDKKQDKSTEGNPEIEKKYQTILADNNRVFFDEIFEKKYKNDPQYLSQATLGKEDDTSKFRNYNVVLANIMNDSSKSNDDKKLAASATDFNNKYISFFNLREQYKDFFAKKYDSGTARKYAAAMTELNLNGFDALRKQKDEMLVSITEYHHKSCELKMVLDALKPLAKDNNPALSLQYSAIKKNYIFPYLQKVVTDMSKNLNSYNENSLPSCDEPKEKEPVKKEAIQENKEEKKEDKKDVVEADSKSVPQKNVAK